MANGFKIDREHLKPVPVGKSDWEGFSQTNYTVDKTLLIKELLDDDTGVALFTRPRRFGKTTALRMLKAFFEKTPKDTSYLFKNFKIWSAGEKYRAEQGKYPVIYLTFKDVDGETFEDAFAKICGSIASEVWRHRETVADSDGDVLCQNAWRFACDHAVVDDATTALCALMRVLHRRESKKILVLVDDYDRPFVSAARRGYFDDMCRCLDHLFGAALKDNTDLQAGILTGCFRVVTATTFTGFNTLSEWSVQSAWCRECFGFTRDEVEKLLAFYGRADKMPEVESWYGGYDFAGHEMFNPWSVVNYIGKGCVPGLYWMGDAKPDLLQELKIFSSSRLTEELCDLLGEKGHVLIRSCRTFSPDALPSGDDVYGQLFFFAKLGLLQISEEDDYGFCRVSIPNNELRETLQNAVMRSFVRPHGHQTVDSSPELMQRDSPQSFRDAIQRFLTESVSFFDNTESFFHGLTLGFLAILRDRYRVRSNRESGEGRFDIELTPLVKDFPGVIIEVKAAKNVRQSLRKLAQEARRQIDEKDYAAEMTAEGVTDILKLGLAYYRKRVQLVA